MSEQSGPRRPAPRADDRPAKRRDVYAPRACDACRRRKGKCCGGHPCEHCVSRNIICHFSAFTGEWRPDATSFQAGAGVHKQPDQVTTSPWAVNNSLGALTELVVSLQGQVESLAAQVKQNNEPRDVVRPPSPASTQTWISSSGNNRSVRLDPIRIPPRATSHVSPATTAEKESTGSSRNTFYGPTCPDYSFNMAQIRLRQGEFSEMTQETANLASTELGVSDDEDNDGGRETGPTIGAHHSGSNRPAKQKFTHFRDRFGLQEALRLISVYDEVVGQYHPILAIDQLMQQVQNIYKSSHSQAFPGPSRADEDARLTITLVLSIALFSESTSPGSDASNVAKLLYVGCRDLVNAKIMSSTPGIRQVIIALLAGILHFLEDKPQYAWRMVGIAGRITMELGFHDPKVARHALRSELLWSEYAVLITSIAVLDRQWSAATGLPTHFGNSSFDLSLRFSANNPYLKAMATFILMSDKFSEPISRVAKGESYEDDDEFDIMNFQIEQWREKSVGSYNVGHIRAGPPPESYPPPWAVLLHLRANSIRVLLLRPFFLFNTPATASQRNLQPALNLITENLDILVNLDRRTDIYRMHHVCFQHILASSAALLFLIIAYTEQSQTALPADIRGRVLVSVARNFRNAFDLAAAYSKSTNASRRLWKRMVQMRKMLIEVGTLPREDVEGVSVQNVSGRPSQQPHLADNPITENFSHVPALEPTLIDFDQLSAFPESPATLIPELGAHEFSAEWVASLSENWQLNNSNGFFVGY